MFSNNFIQATSEYCTYEKYVNAPYLRKTFYVEKINNNEEITICGLGFYRLFVNGKEITKSYLAPYISNIDHIIYYDKYEISKYLNKGKNVIGIILGNGMLNPFGAYNWWFDNASFRSSPKVAFSLKVNNEIMEADESVKVHPSPIIFDDLRAGEKYDANLEINNWNQVDYDDSLWGDASKATTPKGEKRITKIDPIIISREIKPIKIIKSENGYIYDFGYNSAGIIRLNIDGKKNQKISLMHGEILKNNKLDLTNIVFRNAKENGSQYIEYICKEGKQVYQPSFTYMGFRYVYIEGISEEQANEDLLTMLVMHSDLKRVSDFKCSNIDLNKIFNNTINSTLSNFYHFPTDCPQREKNGWTGDASLSADQIMMNLKASKNIKEWLNNIRKSQLETGQIPGVIPTVEFGYNWGHGPAWDSVLIELPYRVYQYENDKEIIYDNAETIFKYIKYLNTKINDEGLVEYGLGDWCQVERKAPDAYETPLCVTDTLYSINNARKASLLFKVIDKEEESKYCEDLSNKLMKSFREKCIDENLEVIGKTQSGQAMALYYGAFKEEEIDKAISHLVKYIKDKDNHFDVGVLGARTIFRVLSKYGYDDLALKLITNPTFPSYSWQLQFGATSLWESFYNMDENFNMYSNMTFEVLSMNHHFWGDISAYFIEYILGIKINPNLMNYDNVIIEPHIMKDISFAEGYHDLEKGRVYVKWKKIDDKLKINVNCPLNINCNLKLPNQDIIHLTQENNIFIINL